MPEKNFSREGGAELREARKACSSLLRPAFLFSIFVNLLMLTGPLFMLQIYDRVLGSRSQETLLALFLLVVALYALMGFLDYARGRVFARFGARFQSLMEERVFSAALVRSIFPSEAIPASSGTRDLERIQQLFTSPVFPAMMDVPWTPLFLMAIYLFHPVLGLLATLGGGTLIALTFANQRLTQDRVLEAQKSSAIAQSFAETTQGSSELIRSQGMTGTMIQRWLAMRQKALGNTIGASDWTGLFSSFTKAFRLLLQSSMLAVGAWLVLQGQMTAGAMIAGSILLGRALAPVEQLLGQWKIVQLTREGWRALERLLHSVPKESEQLPLPQPTPSFNVQALTYVPPGSDKPTLRNVSFHVNPGDVLGVIGPSGSGKSTLARALLGLRVPTHGEIRLGNATLDQYNIPDLARYIGYLPQSVTLFSGSVAENIARMDVEPDQDKIIRAGQLAGAHELIMSLPDGYNTFVGPTGFSLSGGQAQRVALARALYGDPLILLLDEPNSALDNEGAKALNVIIKNYRKVGRSVVIMTHIPSGIAACNNLLALKNGTVLAFGERDQVLKAVTKNADKIQEQVTDK